MAEPLRRARGRKSKRTAFLGEAPSLAFDANFSAETFEVGEFELVVFELGARLPLAAKFSPAECEIVEHVAQGASNGEIAEARGVSYRTVANQLASMYRKLGVNTREELLFALQSEAVAGRGVQRSG